MMRRGSRILVATLAATTALWLLPHPAAHASPLPCSGYGGQGAGGYISSLVQNCENAIGHP